MIRLDLLLEDPRQEVADHDAGEGAVGEGRCVRVQDGGSRWHGKSW